MNPNFATRELWDAFSKLKDAARSYIPPPSDLSVKPLMRAAIVFTAQLAIDATGSDRDETRALEQALLSRLETWQNKAGVMELRLMIYDLAYVIETLTRSARRYALLHPSPMEIQQIMEVLPRDLAIAAVAFTIQLAIDEAGQGANHRASPGGEAHFQAGRAHRASPGGEAHFQAGRALEVQRRPPVR